MEVVSLSPEGSDPALLESFARCWLDCDAHDFPDDPAETVAARVAELRSSGTTRVDGLAALAASGDVIGLAMTWLPVRDNLHYAETWVAVRPEHRRQGVGTAVFDAVVEQVRADGRTTLASSAGADDAGASFLRGRGATAATVTALSRLRVSDVDWPAVEAAAVPHPDYELLRWTTCPEEHLEAFARVHNGMDDTPLGELDFGPEAWSAERVRDTEAACAARSQVMHSVVARHRTTGVFGGYTDVVVSGHQPHLGDQWETAVVPEHRGHRLGLAVKAAMLLWLREVQPQIEVFTTYNSADNPWMLGVNEQLGYRRVRLITEWQQPV